MSAEREGEVAAAFMSLTSTLATSYDIVDLLDQLASHCAQLLNIRSAGLLIADGLGVLHVLAAFNEQTRQLEVLQLQRDEGPCLDCFHSGSPVLVPDLVDSSARWPQFVPAARAAGFASVHAVPVRLRNNVLGALGLFGDTPGQLNAQDLALGQALADVASLALVHARVVPDQMAISDQLQAALTSRVLIEQAKGLVAQRSGVDVAAAFVLLRRYARDHGQRLSDIAGQIVARHLSIEDLALADEG